MVNNIIEQLITKGKISRINELEINRYTNFFDNSYKDNLQHCKSNIDAFPRWGIISGYYAMHDITKLFLAKKFRIKIDFEVHATTIKLIKHVINNKDLINLIELGYKEFKNLANDLAEAKKERVKVQYYTGTDFMKTRYKERANEFVKDVVIPYIEKILRLIE